jgi:DNA-binding transcriptional ArsR family regulator
VEITELLLHPVRLRIVHAVRDGLPFTTSQLCARLPDVSIATVYRQVALLADAGLLVVESEERVRGAVERIYRLQPAKTAIGVDIAAGMSVADHHRGFAAAVAALLAEFHAYLERDGANPLADLVSYRQFSLWLSNDEKAALLEDMVALIGARLAHPPTPGRRQHMLSTIFFPTDESH